MKRFMLVLILGVLISPANAALVSRDLFLGGDGLITYDSESGLEWLDNSALPSLTWTQLIDGVGGWRDMGFRFADSTELNQLLLNVGITKIVWGGSSFSSGDPNLPAARDFLASLGFSDSLASPLFTNITQSRTTTSPSRAQIDSYEQLFWEYSPSDEISWDGPFYLRYLERPQGSAYIYEWQDGVRPGTDPGCQFLVGIENGEGCHQWNTTLVRVAAVPIPVTFWLFGSALGLLGWIRHRTS
jgi:hypothetical protein